MESNDTPCICQIYECISRSAPLIYLPVRSALEPIRTTMLMRGVSGEKSQSGGENSSQTLSLCHNNQQQRPTALMYTIVSECSAKMYKIKLQQTGTRVYVQSNVDRRISVVSQERSSGCVLIEIQMH